MTADETIGDRIRRLRGSMSQVDLATAAGVSVDLIRKLEQGRRHTASVPYLQRIARVLDVDLGELFGRARPVRTGTDGAVAVTAIRDALLRVDDLLDELDDADAPDLDVVQRSVDYAWGAYWAGRYPLLSSIMPRLLAEATAAVHHSTGERVGQAAELAAQVRQIAAGALLRLDSLDLAFTAARDSIRDAERGSDPLRAASMRHTLVHVLIRQGRQQQARQLAERSAAAIRTSTPSRGELVVYGGLLLRAASAASREGDTSGALNIMTEAHEAADRVADDRTDYEISFGPSQATLQSTDVHVVSENYSKALTVARTMPRNGNLPILNRTRHWADLALSHTRMGHHDRALGALLTIERAAPELIPFQRLPRQVVSELLEQQGRTPLRELATRMGMSSH